MDLAAGDAGEHRVRGAADREADHPVVGRRRHVGVEQPVLEVRGGQGQPEQAAVAGGVDARAGSSARGRGTGRGRPAGAGRCPARRRSRCRRAGRRARSGTVSPEAMTLGSPPSSPDPGSAGFARRRGAGDVGRARPPAARLRAGGGTARTGRSRRCRSRPAATPAPGRRRAAGTPARQPAASPGREYVRAAGQGRLQWAPVPQLRLDPTRPLHVLVPTRADRRGRGGALAPGPRPPGRSRRRRRRPGTRRRPRSGCRATARASVPDNGFLDALPRLRLVQLLRRRRRAVRSAGCPRASSSATPAARTRRRRRSGPWRRPSPRSAASRSSCASRTPGAGRSRRTRSLVGARVLIVGAGDIGRTIGRMLAGFDVELTYVARTARDGVRVHGGAAAAPAARRRRRSSSSRSRRRPSAWSTPPSSPRCPTARCWSTPPGAVIVDTDALLAELTAGRLRAALDVTDPEPLPAGHPLWSAPGLLLTPHVGGEVPRDRRPRDGHRGRPDRPRPGRRAPGERGRPLLSRGARPASRS